MTEYLDCVQFKKKKDGGWRAIKLGYAKKNDKGGLDVTLDCLPLPNDQGFTSFTITKQQERQEQRAQSYQAPQSESPEPSRHSDPIDDDIPF